MMEDVLDEIAKEYDGRVKVCQIEIEESAVLAAEFEVGIVPAISLLIGFPFAENFSSNSVIIFPLFISS